MTRFLQFAVATAAASLLAAGLSPAAQAATTVLVSDDFESYGGTQSNFTGFADLNVTDGTVDLMQDLGTVATPYGVGFVDLDGSRVNGGYLRSDAYAFNAGDVVTFEIDYSGSRRGGADGFFYGFASDSLFAFKDVTVTRGAVAQTLPNVTSAGLGGSIVGNLAGSAPWTHLAFTFTAGGAGSLSAYVGTTSADNVGPLVDNFSLSVVRGPVPEPAAWALMILGFGSAGSMLRARRRGLAPV